MTQTDNTTALPPALDAPRERYETRSGDGLAWYADGQADDTPLVLQHSVNAAPSAIEMQPLFDHYRKSRRVLAPELPGFGSSDRPNRSYTPDYYADVLCECIAARAQPPVDMVALSLSAEFAARAAGQAPELFRSLTLISPTGFGNRQPPGETARRRVDRYLGGNLIGPGLFRLLTSRVSIRYFLNLSFAGSAPEALVDYAYRTSHQPGARFAPFAFLSGRLFTRDAVEQLYAPLQLPVLVLYDTDPNISFERLAPLAESRPNWQLERISPSRGLPHFEQTPQVIHALDRFWARDR